MTKLSDIYSNFFLGVDYVKVSEVQAYTVDGGTFTQAAWRTRVINTEDSDPSSICSISSNQITLEAGTYTCNIFVPYMHVAYASARLYNITDSAVEISGQSGWGSSTDGYVVGNNIIIGKFTIASQKTFEIQHYCSATKTDNGFGLKSNISGTSSIYTVAEFVRIKDLSQARIEMADYVKVSDVKATTTLGGTFTSGAWRTRVINTEDSDASGICSIASNQITLAAGTYICMIVAPALSCDSSVARLYNISDTAVELLGNNKFSSNAGSYADSDAIVAGKFTIASAKVFEVQHDCQTTRANYGFGTQNYSGLDEIYTIAEFWRVAT